MRPSAALGVSAVSILPVFVFFVGAACTPRREPARPVSPARAALHEGPLTDFVPAAGLRWMIVAHPAELAHTPSLASSMELLFPGPRLAAFAISTGLDLRVVPVALAAGFDYATLYAAVTHEGALVETRFADRFAGAARVTARDPAVRTISGALGVPQTLVHVRDRLVAVSVGDPTPARVVELYATNRLSRSPAALRGSALSTLPATLEDAPLTAYVPGPFLAEWATGARGLLGAAVALGASARIDGDTLRLEIVITGRFESTDADRLAAAWNDLAVSSMGRLLGLDQPKDPPEALASADRLQLRVRLPLIPLASGLRAAVAADIWEILDGPAPPSPSSRGPLSPP